MDGSKHDHPVSPCDAAQDGLVAVALNLATGRERGEVLEHVESCARCADELRSLSETVDALVELAPEAEPPAGLELQVLERAMASRDRRRRRPPWLAAAVIVALAVVASIIGVWISSSPSTVGHANAPVTAQLLDRGKDVGSVVVTAGQPAWVSMTIDAKGWSGDVRCEVLLRGGGARLVGTFHLRQGWGAWTTTVNTGGEPIVAARVLTADDVVLASATLGASTTAPTPRW